MSLTPEADKAALKTLLGFFAAITAMTVLFCGEAYLINGKAAFSAAHADCKDTK